MPPIEPYQVTKSRIEKPETEPSSGDHRLAQFDLSLGVKNCPGRQVIIIPKIL